MSLKEIVIDLETKGLIERGIAPEIICFSWAYFDDAGKIQSGCDILDFLVFQALTNDKKVIFHNSSFDRAVLRYHQISDVPVYEDTMLMSYVWEPGADHSLDAWGKKLGVEKLPKPWKGKYPTEYTPELDRYCEQDAITTLVLYKHLCGLFESDPLAWSLYKEIELPYSAVIQEMENTGMYIDVPEAQKLAVDYMTEANNVLSQLQEWFPDVPQKVTKYKRYKDHWHKNNYEWVGYDETKEEHLFKISDKFSPSSNAQLAWVLQEVGWKPQKYTKTGQPCVDADTLELVTDDAGDVAKAVLEYRNKQKLVNTFIKPLCEEFLGDDGFVRGNFNQCVTVTGRLSSSNPNLQNLDGRIRNLFIAPPGYDIFNGDLSNIEARMVAFLLWEFYSDDSMAQIFIRDEDFHDTNGNEWEVGRKPAKTVFFARIYGSGVGRIAATLGVSVKEAQAIVNKINRKCPNLQRLIDGVVQHCKANDGLIHTLMGRRLYYPDINSTNEELASRAKRQVFNAVVQGSSADVLKELGLRSMPAVRKHKAYVAAAVHDEKLGYVPQELSESLCNELTDIWSNASLLVTSSGQEVPIKAVFKAGKKWSETH